MTTKKAATVAEVAKKNPAAVAKTLAKGKIKLTAENTANLKKTAKNARADVAAPVVDKKAAAAARLKEVGAKARAAKANVKAAKEQGAPITPVSELLLKAGYVYTKTEEIKASNDTAHGYAHPDGSAALFIHSFASPSTGQRWIVKRADGSQTEGKTAKQLVLALTKTTAVADNVLQALRMLRATTGGALNPDELRGDDNYKERVQLLKKLLNTDKVLVKDSTTSKLIKAFHEALGTKSKAEFVAKAETLLRQESRVEAAVKKVEKAEVEAERKLAPKILIHDDKPILPAAPRLNTKQRKEKDAKDMAELAAQIAYKRRQEEYTPIAVPRPDATVDFDLSHICLLEDPNNGIVLMCLEKPNSQGAICVYNNGSRVAAGVVPTEVLITLRPLVSQDLIGDVNQLLRPITAGVIVTPQAEQHLTAVLEYCKENTIMATETAVQTKKFAAPKSAAKKTAAKKTVETKPAKAAAKKTVEKKATSTGAGRTTLFSPTAKIKVVQKENPGREGTKRHEWYELYRTSKTVADYIAAGGDRGYLKFDSGKGFIEIA